MSPRHLLHRGRPVIVIGILPWLVAASEPESLQLEEVRVESGVVQTPSPSAADRGIFAEIQSLYGRSAYSRVLELSTAFERNFPASPRLPEVLNLKGLALLLTRDARNAAQAFEAALASAPETLVEDRNWRSYVRYNLAAALLEAGDPARTSVELQAIDPESLDSPNRLKYFLLRARCLERLDNHREALSTWITLDRRRDELRISPEMVLSNVERILAATPSRTNLADLEKQAEGTLFADRISYRSIEFLVESGRSVEAREQLRLFLKNHPASPKLEAASTLLRGMREAAASGELAIGLLVPQTGRFARISPRIIQAATLATGIYGPNTDQKIQLVVEDAGEDADSAMRALERLHSRHRVAAILGPIVSKGADAVIQRAEELAIPVVSLAQQAGTLGEFSFQAAVTPAMQTRELARHAITRMGMKRFAILAPKDRFGEEYSREFWNAVEELGGTITAYETYDPGETDFRKPIDRLAGLFYANSRRREQAGLAEARERDQIKKRTRRTEKYFGLPPIIDFEAVFIPDEPKAASLVLPTFAYRDIDSVKILGISGWNSSEFVQRAEKAGEGAIFMDAYLPNARQPLARDFAQKFRGAFGQEASSLEAVAFDAATALAKIIASEAEGASVERMKIASRLRQIVDMPGVTGRISVRQGAWNRDLRVLTVRDSEVAEWTGDPARPASSAD